MTDHDSKHQPKETKKISSFTLFSTPIAESLFVVLPLIVLSIIGLYKEKSFLDIIASPEWSFGAAVFFGQVLVKVVQGILISHNLNGRRTSGERITFIVAIFIVLGLIPSLIILAIMLITEQPATTFILLQTGMFILGLASFLLTGAMVKGLEKHILTTRS